MKPRKPLLVVALVALVLCVVGELGGGVWLVEPDLFASSAGEIADSVESTEGSLDPRLVTKARRNITGPARAELERPGMGIPYLALVDVLLLVTYAFIAATLLLPERSIAPASALTSLVVGLGVLVASLVALFAALGLTTAMVGLFFAFPFGTAVYLAAWGSFPVGAAAATLGAILFFKLVFGASLVLANPRFLQNKGLVLLTGLSLLGSVLVSFLHGLPPRILASITDGVAAIVVAIVGLVSAIIVVLWAIIGLVKGVLSARSAIP